VRRSPLAPLRSRPSGGRRRWRGTNGGQLAKRRRVADSPRRRGFHSIFNGRKADNGGIMFYQEDQYLGSFLRRAGLMASNKEHDAYWEGKLLLLQCTGVKGKNGREIYEGDVVRKASTDPDYTMKGEVYWEPDCAGWAVRYAENLPNYTRGWQSAAEWERYEVIGNIYENPELMETSK
jgi:uncharacterized phage protein (TIGR01671 family)